LDKIKSRIKENKRKENKLKKENKLDNKKSCEHRIFYLISSYRANRYTINGI
jgi:hypothetical protein